jgi:tetratricopeptide (TPR) repeat protein
MSLHALSPVVHDNDTVSIESSAAAARDAQKRGDLEGALAQWQQLRLRFPDDTRGYAECGTLLRELGRFDEADSVLGEGLKAFPANEAITVARAWVAHARGDWPEAERRWSAVRASFPKCYGGYFGGAATLRALRRFDESDQVHRSAFALFPVSEAMLGDFAATAQAQGDLEEASRRWITLHTLFPGKVDVYLRQASSLRDAGLYSEADKVLTAAVARFPVPLDRLLEWARVASERSDWRQATERFRRIASTYDSPRAVVGLAEALFHQRCYEEADEILASAVTRYPDDPEVHRMFAACASQNDRQQEALQRWQTVRRLFPEEVSSACGLIRALTDIGSFDDARSLLSESLRSHATDRGLLEAQANLATRTGAWADAVRMWQELSNAYPEDVNLRNCLMGAQFAERLAVLGASEGMLQSKVDRSGTIAPEPMPRVHRMSEIAWEFESLGDNCDFGLLQRYFGAEPLGLLRWAGTFPDEIIAAAKARFDGVGEPENTVIDVWPNGEYCVTDKRYSMLMHTFTYESVVDRNTFYAQQVKRGRFLKRKLIEDIEANQKLFIYKSPTITKAQAHELKAAMREIGPAWLLVVLLAESGDNVGTVEQKEEGLLLGYIDVFPNFQVPASDAILATWSLICERAFDLWKKSSAAASPQE